MYCYIVEPIEVNVWREEKTLRCQVPLISINEDAHLSLTWQSPSGQGLTSNENVQLRTKENQTEASLTAEFQTLSDGDYSCVATVSLTGTAGVNRTVTSVLAVSSEFLPCYCKKLQSVFHSWMIIFIVCMMHIHA